jgi:predicted ferric reductase
MSGTAGRMARPGAPSGPPARRADPRLGGHVLRGVLVAGALGIGWLWWGDTTAASLRDGGSVLTAGGRVAGLLAGYLVLVQVWLLARIPWFERAVGQDRLTAWHRWLGTNVVVLIGAHVTLVILGYGLTVHRAPLSQLWTVVTTYPEMLKGTIGSLLFLAVAVSSGRRLRQRFSYEVWFAVHLTTYLALLLTFGHQTATGADLVNRDWARLLWQTLCYGTFILVLAFRIGAPLRLWWRHRLVVDSVVPEGPGVVSVWVRGHALERLGAQPGQFLSWRFAAAGHWASSHPYSLSAPVRDGLVRITVKELGDHSRALARLRPGTPALVEGPFGRFTAERSTGRGALLVAGGSGIGPVRALAEQLCEQGRDVVVIFRASRSADLVLAGELRSAQQAGQLRLHEVVGRRGELGGDPLADLSAVVPDVARRDVWVCGPDGMTTSVTDALRAAGVPQRRIHTEEFMLR